MPYKKPDLPPLPETIPELFARARRDFTTSTIDVLESRGRSTGRVPFTELGARFELAARRLWTTGVRPGDRVVVCLPTQWEWFDAWFGALLLGALPVAAAPPGALGSADAAIAKVVAISTHLAARCIVCLDLFLREAERWRERDPTARVDVPLLTPEQLAREAPAPGAVLHHPHTDEVAFLQLTSGSTGLPRAVAIRHRNAIQNGWASGLAIANGSPRRLHHWMDSTVSWLPLYHDMGLIGGVFMSLVYGLDLVLLPPRAFLGRPHLWFEALARSGTSLSFAPNFAYQLCAQRITATSVSHLDLSPWQAMMTGSEMVRPATMAAFFTAFDHIGADPLAARPGYGMAEATLTVSVAVAGTGVRARLPPGVPPAAGQSEVVSTGPPVIDTAVRVTGPDGSVLGAERVGEVEVRGPGVFAGYWNDPEATARALSADGWLRTGDLGFLDAAGEIHLTGRLKEILILRGHNLMPHELEWVAEAEVGGGGAERCGAFSITVAGQEAEGEQAVVVIESDRPEPERVERLRHGVRGRIGRELGIPLADVVVVNRGSMPRTSSGKVRRNDLRDLYLRGQLERLEQHE